MKDIRPREVQNFLYAGGADFGVTLTTSVAVNDYKDPTDVPFPTPSSNPSCSLRGGAATAKATGTCRKATTITASR